MTDRAALKKQLRKSEGFVPHAYQDSLGFWTIGIGRLIDKRKGGGITEEEADYLLENDIGKKERELDARLPWWRDLDEVRQRILVDMAFNLGVDGLLAFKNTLAHVKAGRWAEAAAGMRKSLWARQVKSRADRLAKAMETGTLED